jgi:2-polyprenyl-3-methyl-5-hydroxy-6-metoxy-1,4-benzoquinol methylase
MEKDLSKTMKELPVTKWDPSTYLSSWYDAIFLLNDKNFIINVIKSINLPSDASILEIGCGCGKWSAAFAILGYKVTAIDNNLEMIEQAKKNFPNIKIEFVEDDLLNLKSEASKRKYDLVMNEGVIEHFLDRKTRISAIHAMGNCCIPGGYVYIIVPFISDKNDEHHYTNLKELYNELKEADLDPKLVDFFSIGMGSPSDNKIVRWNYHIVSISKKRE